MEDQPTGHVVKGKDLPGAINVLPAGLGEVLKKRESREFKMEQSSSGMTVSTGTRGGGEVQQTFSASKSAKESSSSFSSSISAPGTLQQQQLPSAMSSSSMQQQKTTSTSFSSSTASSQQQQSFMQGQAIQQQRVLQQQPQAQTHIKHGEEIQQESLKTTIQSAITDLEQDIDKTVVDSGDKENQVPPAQQYQAISENDESAPISTMNPHNGHTFEEYKPGSEYDKKMKWPREFKARPESMHQIDEYVPSGENLIGVPDFSELDGSGKMTEQFSIQQSKEQTMSMQTVTSSSFNGHVQQESQQQIINNPALEKALAPANDADYDSNSLKRRNPRQMFTDSAFYSPKYHPSVQDQVEMAHQLSSSLYTDVNKMSKGQEMYLKRAKTSGDTSDLEQAITPQPDKPLNLKLVMNPEGKLHDWNDLPEEEIPELQQMTQNPEATRQMVEGLQSCTGRGGELFAKRRKKADKWVVEEGSLKTNPSQLADQFLQQQDFQQQEFQQQEYQETTEVNHTTEVVDSGAEERQRLQEDFHQQQLLKQQQGFEMRQERQSNELVQDGPADGAELPPNFKPCSLKGRPFTPTFDLSCHNTQGIDVWATKGPKPYGKSGTLPRTTINQATKSGELPPQPTKSKQQAAPPPAVLEVPQVAICPATPAVNESELIVSSHQQSSTSAISSSSSVTTVKQGGVNSIDLEEQKRKEYEQWFKTQEREQQALEYDCSVKYEATTTSTNVLEAQTVQQTTVQEVATHTQNAQNKDEVDRAKQAAEEQQKRLEQEKREKEMREEQQRLEQMKREQELKEQQLREQQQREQELLEQQLKEQKLREQEAIEQQMKEQQRREQEIREQQLLEQQKLEQEAREQQMREQQLKEQQMREQQMQEQQMREQQMREQQMREQQMREQQMREQQMREQQIQQQQIQQQQMQQQQMSMSTTTTESRSMTQQQSLHQADLSMQVKSGGFLSGSQSQQVDDYTSSLRPTVEGELIRTQGDVSRSHSSMQQQSQMEQVQLRQTSGSKDINDTIRQSGVFVGICGDHNALVTEMENFDYQSHTVTDLVKHFSKGRPGDIPLQIMPQHYQMQHAPPSLSELQEQAREKQFSYQKTDQIDGSSELSRAEQKAAQEKMKLYERRTSLKDFMLMEGEKAQQGNQIIDPSNILQVDGSVEGKKLYNGTRQTSSGRELDSQGRLIDTDKWDNHNAIARGWKDVEDNYHPVTFRKIYGVEKQAPTPVPMMKQATPVAATPPVTSQPSSEAVEGSDL